MLDRRKESLGLIVSLLLSAVLMLLFSRSSPLYPTNNWGEANAFFTIGRGMLAGKVPYRDLALSAGPLVYALHALAACISSVDFLGVWLLEVIFFSGVIFIAWNFAAEISGKNLLSMICTAVIALLLVSGRAFVYGDTVEEFALPMQLWALCDLLLYLKDEERSMPCWHLALHGFMAGCVFWLKYTLIGVHLAFIAVIAIDAVVRERGMMRAFKACLLFAAGAALATLPWLVYFSANDVLPALFEVYLERDWEYLIENSKPVRSALAALASGAVRNPWAAVVLFCGAGYLLRRLVQRRWNIGYTALAASFVCAVLLAYGDGQRYRFSPMAIGAFMMLCAAPLAMLAGYALRQKRSYAVLLACGAVLCGICSCAANESLPFIGYPEDELPQMKFAEIIKEEGGGSLLTYEIADGGFYLALNELPQFSCFADSQAYYSDHVDARQWNITESSAAEWVVSRKSYAPDGRYIRVAEASSPYDRSTNHEKGIYQYYLYRIIGEK